jgi:small subunit ribosomal protein S21
LKESKNSESLNKDKDMSDDTAHETQKKQKSEGFFFKKEPENEVDDSKKIHGIRDNRNFEIFKQFRRECAGIVSEVKERGAYMKPSVKRKKKDEKALRRLRKREKRRNQIS